MFLSRRSRFTKDCSAKEEEEKEELLLSVIECVQEGRTILFESNDNRIIKCIQHPELYSSHTIPKLKRHE
jgi:hypothetical protein